MNLSELLTKVQELRQEFDERLATITDNETLEKLRVTFVGRKGQLSMLRSEIPKLPVTERKSFGTETNSLQKHIEKTIAGLRIELADRQLAETLQQARADIDLPVVDNNGARHPVSLVTAKVHDIFRQLGFSVMDGPDIDFVDFNFTKLNIPEHHPARDMHDTFYLQGDQQLLRTHTSNVQVHTMTRYQPPMRVISTGRCFRCDLDLTHTPMFHQLEGFMIDDNISFAHLKGTIETFIRELYAEQTLSLRFRPSYFPFVEPGAEVDMGCVSCKAQGCRVCKQTGWLEVAGCGMIHPNVFEALNIDSERYSGFAFGFGIDRLAMLYYGITDLRSMFSGRSDFLGQFPLC